MNTKHGKYVSPPVLQHFKWVEPLTWMIRFSCISPTLFYEITNIIKAADKSERRWDPMLYKGQGAWVVYEGVLYDIAPYFPTIEQYLATNTIDEVIYDEI